MWLIPRLQKFYALHPDIDVRISTSLGLVDFLRDDFDAAIRLGSGQWFGLETIKLFDESVTPMCSPRLLEGPDAIKSPDDLRKHVLLHNHSMDYDPDAPTWATWLEAAGASGVMLRAVRTSACPTTDCRPALMVRASCWVGVLSLRMTSRRGRVVEPFDLTFLWVELLPGLSGSALAQAEHRSLP